MTEKTFNFNHRVVLQREVQANDEFGGITNSFEQIAEVWSKITPIKSLQNFSKMKEEIETTHIIEVRYDEKYRECKRIIFGNRTFDVIGFYSKDENYEIIIFNAKELV